MVRRSPLILTVFFIPLLIYTYQLCPTVYVHDSGELITASCLLGIAHPAGSPTYCVIGKMFQLLIPTGSVAFQMNAMSAFFAALSVLLLYLIARTIIGHSFISLIIAFIFAFSKTFWSQALVAEVYTLMTALFLLSLFLLLEFIENDDPRYLYSLGFCWGLLLTVHMEFSLMTPMLWLIMMVSLKKKRQLPGVVKYMFWLSFFFVMGLLPYLYLPLRSMADSIINWGNPETWSLFIDHLTARNVQHRMFALELKEYVPRFYDYFRIIMDDTIYLGLAGLCGLFLTWPARKVIQVLLLMFLSIDAAFIVFLDQVPIQSEAYGIPSVLIACLGLVRLGQMLAKRMNKWSCLVLLMLPGIGLVHNWGEVDRHNSFIAVDNVSNILDQLPPQATLFSREDNRTFILLYMQTIEKKRQDVTVYDTANNVFTNPYGMLFYALSQPRVLACRQQVETRIVLDETGSGFQVFYTDPHLPYQSEMFDIVPCGVLGRADVKQGPSPDTSWCEPITVLRGETDPAVSKDWMTKAILAMFYYNLAQYQWLTDTESARGSLRKAAEEKDSFAELHYMIGRSYLQQGFTIEAIEAFERAMVISPRLWEARVQLAYIMARQGEYKNALEFALEALSMNKQQPEVHQVIALIQTKRRNDSRAEFHYRKAVELDPTSFKNIYNLSLFYMNKKQYQDAERILADRMDIFPDETRLLTKLYQSYIGQEKWHEVNSTAAHLCRLEPGSVKFKLLLAESYLKLHENPRMLEIIRPILAIDPANQRALSLLNQCGEQK